MFPLEWNLTRRMLISARSPEELRIALLSGKLLESYQVEVADSTLSRGNIYRGTIAGIQPALNAAFVDFGAERNGFLAIQDVVAGARTREPASDKERPAIDEVLERGRPIVVQVTRDPEGTKGAALTTNLSLAGRYLVITPLDGHRGVSRKVEDEEARRELKEMVAKLDLPEGSGVIVRTNALGQTRTELNRDAAALVKVWKRIQAEAKKGRGPKLLYGDQDLIIKALRDLLDNSVEEILVDDQAAFDAAQAYIQTFLPRAKVRLELYTERVPLFSAYELEAQIEGIYRRSVPLPCGGAIVIDGTEALTAIDVNSGKSTRAASQEETAYATNLEAAREVARQLRLRDIGGLVVVDFIDMKSMKHRRAVEKAVKDAMKSDKARSSIGRLSVNGLLEINRQRIQQELKVRSHRACPTCDGTGRIASPEMVGLNLLRRIEARAVTGRLQKARIELHPELADAFQNQRRQELARLEHEFEMAIEIIASPRLHRPDEVIQWVEREGGAVVEPAAKKRRAAVEVRDMLTAVAADEPEVEEAEDEPDAEAEAGAEAGNGRKRKRRKRKGRERPAEKPAAAPAARTGRRKAAPKPPQAPKAPAPVPAAAQAELPLDPEGEGAAEGGGKSRRTRHRPRRRGKGEEGKAAGSGAERPESAPDSAPASGGEAPSEGGAPAAGGDAKARRRRRRRRGGRPAGGNGSAPANGGDAPPAGGE